jgi:hypothetical protein
MEACRSHAKYLVLHFLNGRLTSSKITHSWRGALMSKRNHQRHCYDGLPRHLRERLDAATRILPMEAIYALRGLEKPDTDLSADDLAILKSMGIGHE